MGFLETGAQRLFARRTTALVADGGGSVFSNTVTETSILGAASLKLIPGGMFAIGDILIVSGGLLWLNNTAATQTLTVKVKLNGTAIMNLVSTAVAASATTYNVAYEAIIRMLSGPSTNAVSKLYVSTAAGTGTTAMTTLANPAQGSLPGAFSGAFDITATLSTATATGTITPKGNSVLWVPGGN